MTSNFDDRIRIGRKTEERGRELLRQHGLAVEKIGLEHRISEETSEYIQKIHDDNTISFIRHMPDILTFRKKPPIYFLVDFKATSEKHRGKKSKNFSIETASLKVCKSLMYIGIRVLIMFEDGFNEFFGDWASEIKSHSHYSHSEMRAAPPSGSGTPMTLVKKESVTPIEEKLKTILSNSNPKKKTLEVFG